MLKHFETRNDGYICIAILYYLVYTMLNAFSATISGFPMFVYQFLFLARYGLYAVMLFGLLCCLKRLDYRIVIFALYMLLFVACNYLFYDELPARFSQYVQSIVFVALPLAVLVYSTKTEGLLWLLSTAGIFIGFWYLLIGAGIAFGVLQTPRYDNSFGYCAIIPMACLIQQFDKQHSGKKLAAFLSLAAYCVFSVVFSSRGSMVVILAIFLYVFFTNGSVRKEKPRKTATTLIACVVILLALVLYRPLLEGINSLLTSVGMTSRTLTLLVSNDALHVSGRELLYEKLLDEIRESPFALRGIASDTVLLGGSYAHNLPLEVLYQFGVLAGIPFLVFLAYQLLRSLLPSRYRDNPFRTVLAIIALITLVFSSSLWLSHTFWMWFVLVFQKSNAVNPPVTQNES